jgi:Arc/MetJ family transcription regulator
MKLFATKKYQAAGIALAFFALLLSAGCGSPSKRVTRHVDDLKEQWRANVVQQANLQERTLDWPAAVDLMLRHNLKLRQTRSELTNAHENVRQVFKDLLPTLNGRAGVSKQIGDFGNIGPNDLTISADSFFNIPGVVSFGARYYAARLYQIRAEAAYQLAEREQMIELYRLFFTSEELRDQKRRLETQRAAADAMRQVDAFTAGLMLTEMETRELGHLRERKGVQDRAGNLLGTRDYQWAFVTNGLPDLQYHLHPLPLTDTNRVAQLQMKLLAVELEAARAQMMGLKLRYWPELNIFVSGPPIYNRSQGTDRFWDAEDVRISADLFWTVDTRGHLARSIRQTRRQQALQRERYREETLALMNRLLFTQRLIGSVQKHLGRVESHLALLEAVPPAPNFSAIQKYAYDYRALTQQQLHLKRELSELNALFWFVDEGAWTEQTTAHAAGSG